MIAWLVIFLAVILYLTLSGSFQVQGDGDFSNLFFLITAGLTAALLPASYFLFRRRLSDAGRENAGLEELMTQYKSAFVVKMGLIEMPAFFSMVVMLMTGNPWLLVQIIAVILVMIINRPTAEKIVGEMKLDRSNIQAIQNL